MTSDPPLLPMNPALKGQAEMLPNIVYSKNGQTLTLLLPWAPGKDGRQKAKKCPLIVFIQGSAWTTPNLGYEIPMLSHFAEEGIAVATVSHRSAADGHPFPAFLVDVKCAIRFLRAHAADYAIDPERVAAFGTSSGGNTVCLLGLTGDDPSLKSEEYASMSDAVCGVAACFAPTDLPALFDHLKDSPEIEATLTAYFGRDPIRREEFMRAFSPVFRVEKGKHYPPFLLLHGTGDPLVPCSQTEALFARLKENGNDVEAYFVDGAEHEGNFWSPRVRAVIRQALRTFLGQNPQPGEGTESRNSAAVSIRRLDEEDDAAGTFLHEAFTRFGLQHGVALNYEDFCFAAEDSAGRILGVITGRACYNEVHIGDLIVAEGCRGKGLGSRLVAEAENAFKGKGYDVITLTTFAFQAPEFYQRLGYQVEFVRESRDPRLRKYFLRKAL